jgi:hypothetical protein
MPDDDQPEIPIPAFIRSMLDPFVNVMGESDTTPPKRVLERTLLEPMFRPTDKHLAAIGRVTTVWSVMERVMGMTIARLSLAPEFTTLALTRELTANNQIRVLRTLIPLHGERYKAMIVNDNLITELKTLPTKILALKDQRNIVAHTVWQRKNDDTIVALRSKPTTESKVAAEPALEKTVAEIEKLADDIQAMADHLFILTQLLPAVDEARQAQSLAQDVQSLHDELLGERPSPPESFEG